MNSNAPFHQPEVIPDVDLIRWASDKMFSNPEDLEAQALNALVVEHDNIEVAMKKLQFWNEKKNLQDKKLHYPTLTVTPDRDESNILSASLLPIRVDINQGLKVLDDENGTNAFTTDVYLQFICDFANQWHSKLTGIDCRSPGTAPMFYCLDQSFFEDVMVDSGETLAETFQSTHLSRTQFWKLRYLFVPISFRRKPQLYYHVALCAISPEARTVDYICSGGDNGMYISERSAGSKCVPTIFAWLAEMLQSDPTEGFMPYQWRFRPNAGYRQILYRKDCGIYTVSHAMALAFGWGLRENGAFPIDHQTKICCRRARYVQDLMYHGFRFFDPECKDGGPQYYPLLDTPPSNSKSDGFVKLHADIIEALPEWAQNRRACYVDCPSVAKLKEHCRRNARFYPGYEAPEISGAGVNFEDFLTWIESVDRRRKSYQLRPLPYPKYKPRIWIDPRDKAPRSSIVEPLW